MIRGTLPRSQETAMLVVDIGNQVPTYKISYVLSPSLLFISDNCLIFFASAARILIAGSREPFEDRTRPTYLYSLDTLQACLSCRSCHAHHGGCGEFIHFHSIEFDIHVCILSIHVQYVVYMYIVKGNISVSVRLTFEPHSMQYSLSRSVTV